MRMPFPVLTHDQDPLVLLDVRGMFDGAVAKGKDIMLESCTYYQMRS
jgi:hypothetical protein